MVAFQLAEASESRGGGAKLRRARLGVVSSTLGTFTDMPEHLRNVVAGISKEIEDRCFRPILAAPDLDVAMAQTQASFVIFAELWSAVLSALAPWLLEDPERLAAVSHAATDTWTSGETLHAIGDEAASWFAATQDARASIVHALMRNGVLSPSPNEEEIVRLCVVVDFTILFGIFLAQHTHPRIADGLAVAIGKLGYESAKRAYVLATAHRFADPEPAAVGA